MPDKITKAVKQGGKGRFSPWAECGLNASVLEGLLLRVAAEGCLVTRSNFPSLIMNLNARSTSSTFSRTHNSERNIPLQIIPVLLTCSCSTTRHSSIWSVYCATEGGESQAQ